MRIGELLIQHGRITREQLEQALQAQKQNGGRLGTNLVELGLISDAELAAFLSHQLQVPPAKRKDFEQIPAAVLALVDADFAGRHGLVPLRGDSKITVAISDPRDISAIDELGFKLGRKVEAVIAPEIWIQAALERYYHVPRPPRGGSMAIDLGEEFVGEVVHEVAEDMQSGMRQKGTSLTSSEFGQRLLLATSPEDVIVSLFAYLSPLFPRMAVFAIRKEQFCGWMLHGFPLHTGEFNQVAVAVQTAETFRKTAACRQSFYGQLLSNKGNQLLYKPLGLGPHQAVGLFPLCVKDRAIAVLLTLLSAELPALDPTVQEKTGWAVTQAGLGMEIHFLKRQLERATQGG